MHGFRVSVEDFTEDDLREMELRVQIYPLSLGQIRVTPIERLIVDCSLADPATAAQNCLDGVVAVNDTVVSPGYTLSDRDILFDKWILIRYGKRQRVLVKLV